MEKQDPTPDNVNDKDTNPNLNSSIPQANVTFPHPSPSDYQAYLACQAFHSMGAANHSYQQGMQFLHQQTLGSVSYPGPDSTQVSPATSPSPQHKKPSGANLPMECQLTSPTQEKR